MCFALTNNDQTPPLMDAILKSVFHNVGKLLRSQKIITSTSERSLLKNLGSWLGKITLGRDKPVLQRELDMKELLFQVTFFFLVFLGKRQDTGLHRRVRLSLGGIPVYKVFGFI